MKLLQSSVVLLILMCASFASAQNTPQPAVAMFLTEDWSTAANTRAQAYWWKTPSKPAWSPLDKILRPAMQKQGVTLPGLKPNAPFSTVYRRPHMAPSNAAALLTLIGQKQALVGSVIYHPVASQDPFATVGVRVVAKVLVVQSGQTQFDVKKMITIRRSVFAASNDLAMSSLRSMLAADLSGVLARTLKQRQGSVGIASTERLIVLQGVTDQRKLEAIKARLVKLDTIQKVRVKWVSSGHIALEINPKKQDNEDTIEQATRTLIEHDFKTTGFRIAKSKAKVSAQVSMLTVQPVIEESIETTP